MKKFNEFITEEKKIVDFFAHYRSGKDEKHDPEKAEDKEPTEFFAHYRSGKDNKHNPEKVSEGFEHSESEEKKVFSANKKILAQHKKIEMSRGEKDTVRDYTFDSRYINNTLIKSPKKINKIKSDVDILDKVTNHPSNKLSKPVTTYSGVSDKFASKLSKVKPGGTVHSPAYISSTVHRETAGNFAKAAPKTNEYHHIQFHLPQGYQKGRYIEHASHNEGEHEFLMARNQKFKYLGKTTHPRGDSVDVVHHVEPIED